MDNQKTVQLTANETLRGLRSGDTAVLKQIYTDHFGACYRKISAAGGTMEECREVFQEGLYVLLVKAKDPDFQLKTSFQGYLVQTCYFLWLKPQKNIRRLVPLLNEEVRSDNNVASRAEFEQKEKNYSAAFAAVRELTEACRSVLELFFLDQYSDKEIAEKMDYSTKFVKNKRQRCLNTLRGIIAKKLSHG
jgi:RNA polymerase sigma factor (sigma-70 family)